MGIHRNEGKIMNEKTLLVLCYLITIVCILPFRKRLSKVKVRITTFIGGRP